MILFLIFNYRTHVNLANSENKSLSSLAQELMLEALEKREDMALSLLAESREKDNTSMISHEDAWK